MDISKFRKTCPIKIFSHLFVIFSLQNLENYYKVWKKDKIKKKKKKTRSREVTLAIRELTETNYLSLILFICATRSEITPTFSGKS